MTAVDKTIPWLAGSRPIPAAGLRLFCFPYAGGGAHTYRHWSKHLPAHVEVCAVQLPGRGGRLHEPRFTRMEPLVKAVLRELRPYLDRPFAFFGHSMGAVISFELARLLRREHAKLPVHVFVSGRSAPQLSKTKSPTYRLGNTEFMEELRRLKGTPPEVLNHPDLMQVVLPLLRADFELIETYIYTDEPPLKIPLTAFGGLADLENSRESLGGWRAQTTAEFSLRMLPGDHFYLTSSEELLMSVLARELSSCQLRKREDVQHLIATPRLLF
jgi:medium-chain acyl-[acyl-carrier-protein] hydrolase